MKGGRNYKDVDGGGGYNSPYHHHHNSSNKPSSSLFPFPRLMISFLLFLSLIYFFYTITLLFTSPSSCPDAATTTTTTLLSASSSSFSNSTTTTTTSAPPPPTPANRRRHHSPPPPPPPPPPSPTTLRHIVFGIAASSNLWERRRDYIKLWWRPSQMRGFVWLDKPVNESKSKPSGLPALKISADTSKFPYTHRQGSRSALRISRIVSETFRLALPDARWFVMGDDDTVFLPDNLLRVLSRLDHTQPYYIGSLSESHLQNIFFSYGMAYGGGGFAISLPLSRSLSKMQDSCLHRYPALYGFAISLPLTRHPGFHQYDVYGDLLSAHCLPPPLLCHPAPLILRSVAELSHCVSSRGLVAGQVADMESTGASAAPSLNHLKFIHIHKTAALLEASAIIGAILPGRTEEKIEIAF